MAIVVVEKKDFWYYISLWKKQLARPLYTFYFYGRAIIYKISLFCKLGSYSVLKLRIVSGTVCTLCDFPVRPTFLLGFHQILTTRCLSPLSPIYTRASCSHPSTPKCPNSIQPPTPPPFFRHQLHPGMMTVWNFAIIHHQQEEARESSLLILFFPKKRFSGFSSFLLGNMVGTGRYILVPHL